ncbi:hypothetical protein RJD38_21725 (plasmid) [Vibrio scophthalmi]|uniref:hypothetical protein n=1 Tax=Vibrio scophthalmi TaxID=45658 RepID=UPI00080999EC|nr:hypothetical protein [Vibrio scophthalmi]ANS88104.1 hypothetical protein VSVS12_04405 [Vibrio scophthalmi]
MNQLMINQSQHSAFVLTEVLKATGYDYVRGGCSIKDFDESYLFRQYSYDEAGKWWVFLNHVEEWLVAGKPVTGFLWSFLLYVINPKSEMTGFVCLLLDFEPLEAQNKLGMFKLALTDIRAKKRIEQSVA